MEHKYIYEAVIRDTETDEIVTKISSFSPEGLEGESGKRKWTEAVKVYEEKLKAEEDSVVGAGDEKLKQNENE